MSKQKKSGRLQITYPETDMAITQFIKAQENCSISLKKLMRLFTDEHGFVDVIDTLTLARSEKGRGGDG